MDEEVVTELIQEDLKKNIRRELQKILEPNHRKQLYKNMMCWKN
jgi:lipid-A-disaccharide synthase